MRLVPTGRGSEVRVVFDVRRCSNPDCGRRFDRLGTYRPTPHRCDTHERSHYSLECRACGTVTWDETCDQLTEHRPLEGHGRTVQPWDDVQHGPTLDLGDG